MTIKEDIDANIAKITNYIIESQNDAIENGDDEISQSITPEIGELIDQKQDELFPNFVNGEYKKEMILKAIDNANKPKEEIQKTVLIYVDEIKKINSLPHLIEKQLLYCLIVYERLHPHSSNWIHFEYKKIIEILFNEKQMAKIRREDFSCLIQYGLDFRVVGSKMSMACYKLPDMSRDEVAFEFLYSKENCKKNFQEITNA